MGQFNRNIVLFNYVYEHIQNGILVEYSENAKGRRIHMRRILSAFKNIYYNSTIARKINLTNMLIILVPILILAILSKIWSTNSIIQKTINNSVQNLQLVTQSLGYMTNNAEQQANIIVANSYVQEINNKSKSSDNEEIFKYEQVVGAFLDSVFEPRDQLSSSVIYKDDKIAIGSSKVDLSYIKNVKTTNENQYVQDANFRWLDLHQIFYLKSQDNVYNISFKKNIIDALDGSVIGTVIVNINEEDISNSYSRLKYGQSGQFLIVNKAGSIVSSENKQELFKNIGNEKFFQWAQSNIGTGNTFNIQGKTFLVTSSRFDKLDWYVLGLIPLDEVTADTKKITFSIYMTGVLCLLLAMGSSILITRTISAPLVELSRSMTKVGLGDFDVSIQPLGKDEVGILSNRFNKMTLQISELMNQVYTEQKMKKHFELIALQAQINPHFLYNTLDNLSSLIQMNMNQDAFRMVKALSSFYRSALSDGENIIFLKDEMKNTDNYLIIQKIRYSDDFDFTITIDDQIANFSIPKLSIQPIVENAIYHGIRNKREKGTITINAYLASSYVVVSVSDNGIGMPKTLIDGIMRNEGSVRSYGLHSVNERIKLYFGSEYGLKISSELGIGTKVDIILPIPNGGSHDQGFNS
jgi:two-component system sensor histidine kinase YesM